MSEINDKQSSISHSPVIDVIRTRRLFNKSYYEKQVGTNFGDYNAALFHYLKNAIHNRCDPHILFSTNWYYYNSQDVELAGINALMHYVEMGKTERRSPHPIFHIEYALSQVEETKSIFDIFEFAYSTKFLNINPNPLFDVQYYIAGYKHKSKHIQHPMLSFLEASTRNVRSPHPLFDLEWYAANNPDVPAGTEYIHFLKHGAAERRDPSPMFSSRWYEAYHNDLEFRNLPPVMQYLQYGYIQRRMPNPLFDFDYYRIENANNINSDVDLFSQYIKDAVMAKSTHRLFSASYYMRNPKEFDNYDRCLLNHFLEHGLSEGRRPNPYGQYLEIDGDDFEEKDDELLFVGKKVYKYHEDINFRLIQDALRLIWCGDKEEAALLEQIDIGIGFSPVDFSNVILQETVRLVDETFSFDFLIISCCLLSETDREKVVEIVDREASMYADTSGDLYFIGFEAEFCNEISNHSRSISGTKLNEVVLSNEHYFIETIKSLLVSVKFKRVFLVLDENTCALLSRYGRQLAALQTVTFIKNVGPQSIALRCAFEDYIEEFASEIHSI